MITEDNLGAMDKFCLTFHEADSLHLENGKMGGRQKAFIRQKKKKNKEEKNER